MITLSEFRCGTIFNDTNSVFSEILFASRTYDKQPLLSAGILGIGYMMSNALTTKRKKKITS